jgi:uncharacterized glyoxalase superfamily protein PhnB
MSSGVYYDDPAKAIDWLCKVFGFEVRLKVEGDDGSIVHSELVFGDGLVMVGDANKGEGEKKRTWLRSPKSVGGGNTQAIMVFVDDVEAHAKHAQASGAKITMAPETHDYGEDYWADRSYEVEDLEGHHWWFTQRLRG